jgi:hypothetical protein
MEWFSGFGGDTQIQQAVGDRVSEFLALSHN